MLSAPAPVVVMLAALAAIASCSEATGDGDAGLPHVAAAGSPGRSETLGEGFLVWESNRSGSWRIWTRALDGSGLRQLSPEEPDRDHFGAHISPDGTRVAYLSYPEGSNSYRDVKDGMAVELRTLRLSDGEEQVVARDARSYGQSRSVVWIDGHRLFYLASDHSTRELDLRTGEASPVASAPAGRGPYLLNPTGTHGTGNEPTFSPYDAKARNFSPAPQRAGCQSYFTRDGRFGFWAAASGGPILRIDLARGRSTTLIDRDDARLPEGFRYVYFPMVSPDQRLLAWAASGGDHDHFRADYEIFVAALDPMTLELRGEPTRHTFDPGTDRFPDVFRAGLELGHLAGEVPFPVEIDPAHLGPEHDPGEGWRWDFGDGATSEGAVGTHTYASPGTFALVARRGARELRARVDVEPPAPPQPTRTVARARDVEVTFDEAIDAGAVAATLSSGIAVTEVSVKPDRRTLRLRTETSLPAFESLHLEGVRDLAGHVAPTFTLDLERKRWPASDDALVFLFGTARDENRVRDPRSGHEADYPLFAHGRARFDHDGALELSGGRFEARGAGEALASACREADAISLEALIRPRSALQAGPVTILNVEDEGGRSLLQLDHRRDQLRWRLRTGDTDPKLPVATVESLEAIHLVVAYRNGRLVSYRNGRKAVDTDQVRGDVSMLAAADGLHLGGGSKDGSGWQGALEGVAVYCRFLGHEEAVANAHAYGARIAEREVVPRHRIRARLAAVSHVPTLEEIAPYRDALVVYEWEVLRVLDGAIGEDRVRVAHWAVLGGASQPIPAVRPGAKGLLELELLDDNEQAATFPLMDDLEPNPDVPLFLDVGV